MTLNQTIINKWGIWQCSDHRVTDVATGKVIDDYSIKHVILRCPDGAALLAYEGAARMAVAGRVGSVDLSDWVRETLRGETRTLDQSFILIRENATRDLARSLRANGIYHMFSIGAFLAGRPWTVQIRNFTAKAGDPNLVLLDHFETVAKEITGAGVGFVYGDPRAINPQEMVGKLMTLASRKPGRPKDFRNAISPGCVASYMPPKGEPFESEFHGKIAAPTPFVVPMLLFGIE